jgi:predicted dehydrogenase
VKFGLFGTGHWAAHTHGAALAAHPGVDFVGVWGRDMTKASMLAQSLGTRPFDDADGLIAAVDAVAIALPPQIQAGIAVRAATAGRHLLLDKPLALDLAAANAVVEAVDRAGVSSLVFFTARYTEPVAQFLRAATERAWYGSRSSMCGSIFVPGSPYGSSVWRREKGGLWDVGPHALALVVPVLGPVVDVAAMTGPRTTTQVLLRHESGAVSHLTLTVDAPPAAVGFNTEFAGPDETVAVPRVEVLASAAFGVAIDELLADVAAGRRSHPCDVRFGREVVAVLARAEKDAAWRAAGGHR